MSDSGNEESDDSRMNVTEDEYSNDSQWDNPMEHEHQEAVDVEIDDINEFSMSMCSRSSCSCNDKSAGYGSLHDSTLEGNSNWSIHWMSIDNYIQTYCMMPRTSSPHNVDGSSRISSLTLNFTLDSSCYSPILDDGFENMEVESQNEENLNEENEIMCNQEYYQDEEMYSQDQDEKMYSEEEEEEEMR